jgi:hypothetical protein
MTTREQVPLRRKILNRLFIQGLLIPTFFLSTTAGLAQSSDDLQIHIQPRQAWMAQSQTPPSGAPEPDQQQTQQTPQAQPTQNQPPDQAQTNQPANPAPNIIMVPAGTRLPLVLARPLSVKKTRPGDTAYFQTTFPITVGNQIAIPPGTYFQGVIANVTNRDKTRGLLTLELRSASIIFSTGYSVDVPGPISAAPQIAFLAPHPQGGEAVPVMAVQGGPTPPPLPPLPPLPSFNKAIIFGAVGTAAVIGLLIFGAIHHGSDAVMSAGAPVEVILPGPVVLQADLVDIAVKQYSARAANVPPPVVQPANSGTCWTAGSPGTPDQTIPGTPAQTIPGTPDVVIPGDPPTVIPGTPSVTIPGTPDVVVPGTPGTDPAPYPCPK